MQQKADIAQVGSTEYHTNIFQAKQLYAEGSSQDPLAGEELRR